MSNPKMNFSPLFRNSIAKIHSSFSRPTHFSKFEISSRNVYVGFFSFLFIAAMSLGVAPNVDKSGVLLEYDTKKLTTEPTFVNDSIAYHIKFAFDKFSNQDINPRKFKYFTSTKEHAALILVQIPNLHQIKQEGRYQAIQLVELISSQYLASKDVYIGIIGKKHLMLAKTPTANQNSRKVSWQLLHDFYAE